MSRSARHSCPPSYADPPADFTTKRIANVVDLVESCRPQQVSEGHFAQLADVPRQVISLTIPALLTPPRAQLISIATQPRYWRCKASRCSCAERVEASGA